VDRKSGVTPGEERALKLFGEPLGGVEAAAEYLPEEFLDEGRVRRWERGEFSTTVPNAVACILRRIIGDGQFGSSHISPPTAGEMNARRDRPKQSADGDHIERSP